MTEQIVVETKAAVKFSDMETGASGWAMYIGSPTPFIKTEWVSSGSRATNARRLNGRNGRISIPANAEVFTSSGECRAAFEAKRQAFLESRNEQQERPFVFGHPANGYL